MIVELQKEKEKLEKIKSFSHDDRFLIMALKTNTVTNVPLNLTKYWKSNRHVVDNTDQEGKEIVSGYYRRSIDRMPDSKTIKAYEDKFKKYKGTVPKDIFNKHAIQDMAAKGIFKIKPLYKRIKDYEKLPKSEKRKWLPYYQKKIDLDDGIKVVAYDNQVYLRLTCLPKNLKSRYRMALEQMVQLWEWGIIDYRGKSTILRNIKEALRHQLHLKWLVTEYEHNIIFCGQLGKTIFDDLLSHDIGDAFGKKYPTTIYLKGGKEAQIWIKYYNISAKEEDRTTNRKTDIYKLEITFKKNFFKTRKLRDVRKFIEQPDIQELLSDSIKKHFTWTLKKLTKETKAMLKREYKAKNERDLAAEVTTKDRTLTFINRRIDKIDNEITKLKKRIGKLEKKVR